MQNCKVIMLNEREVRDIAPSFQQDYEMRRSLGEQISKFWNFRSALYVRATLNIQCYYFIAGDTRIIGLRLAGYSL
jgi:hypothetical protein